MQDVDPQQLYEHLQECDDWLAEHFNELIEQYPGKIVAIKGGKVVGVGNDYDDVYHPSWEAGEKIMPLVLRVPYPDDPMEFLL